MLYAPTGVTNAPNVGVQPSIGLDLYPANVVSDDGFSIGKVRVVGLNGQNGDPDRVLVYRSGSPAPVLVSSNVVVAHHRDVNGLYVLQLDDGTTITVNKAQGCGCGSSLKYFRAFPMGRYGASW